MRHRLEKILNSLGVHDAPDGNHGARRSRSIRLAVLTSLLSKGGSALLQLVSVPIAIRVLGFESFGIYSTVALAVVFVAVFQVGVGPGLTHGISRAFAKGDRQDERDHYSTSFFLMLAMTFLGGSIAYLVFSTVPVTVLFGEQYARHAEEMRSALWLGTGIILVQFALTHTERTRDGYLETNINNAWGAAGNVLGALAVGIGIFFFPTIDFLLLSVYGSNALAKIGNTIHLLVSRRHLVPSWRHFNSPLARELFKDGFAYSVAGALTPLIQFNVCAIIVAHIGGPSSVGVFNLLIQIDTILAGFIVMFTMPTWPAIADAFARRDIAWIRAITRRLRAFSLSYAAAAGTGLILLGPALLPIWIGDEIQISQTILIAFALFFFIGIHNHVNQSLLIGSGKIATAALYCALESGVALCFAATGISFFGLPGLLIGLFIAKTLVTGTIFPKVLRDCLRAQEISLSDSPSPSCASATL